MRIALISTSQIPSKTANSIQVMKICQAFRQLGHEVQLWVPHAFRSVDWAQLQSHYGLEDRFPIRWVKTFKPLRRYDFALRAVLAGRSWRADCYYIWPLQAAAIASALGLPTILEMHDRPQGRFGPALFRAYLKGRGARRLLVITRALRDWLSAAYDLELDSPLMLVSPMGVDLERYEHLPAAEHARELLGIPQHFTAGYTGHLYSGRGVELLFQLAQSNPEIQFLWVGGEPAAVQSWKERVACAGLENVHLAGFVENSDLPIYQAACELLLMPYERQISISSGGDTAAFASPMKVFEYMATERVILSSDLAVLREVLNESNAILLPPEDLEAWDAALKRIVATPAKWQPLAHKAREEAAMYSWKERARRSLEGL